MSLQTLLLLNIYFFNLSYFCIQSFLDLMDDPSQESRFCSKYKKQVIGFSFTCAILVIIATAMGLELGLKGLYYNVNIIFIRKKNGGVLNFLTFCVIQF